MKEKKIREIIDKIVPYLNSDGGNLEFIKLEDDKRNKRGGIYKRVYLEKIYKERRFWKINCIQKLLFNI